MHTYLMIIGPAAALLFFLIDKNLLPGVMLSRKSILIKLEKNKKREIQLHTELESIINIHNAWSYNAFPDTDVTYAEYVDLLKEKTGIEYSESEFEKLRTENLTGKQIADYADRLKDQEETVSALQADINSRKANLEMLSYIAAAC